MPPNYYFNLEDTVERRVKNGAKWTYSSLRPPAIIGFSTGGTMNLMTCLAVHGTICRELGVAMKYVLPVLSHSNQPVLATCHVSCLLLQARARASGLEEIAKHSW